MEKFRFKVWRNDYTVTMKIFEQPEETRGKEKLFEHNGVEIHSVDYPELEGDCVFTRGEDLSEDNRAAIIRFESLDKAEAYRKKIVEALTAYAKHLEEQEAPKCADKLVYQFDRVGCVVVATPICIPEWANKKTKLYENEVFEVIQSAHTVLYDTGLCFVATTNKDWYRQAATCFNNEAEASEWIKQATNAIGELNKQYAIDEPVTADITKETVIAE